MLLHAGLTGYMAMVMLREYFVIGKSELMIMSCKVPSNHNFFKMRTKTRVTSMAVPELRE